MEAFSIKTASSFEQIEKPHFFVLNKGMNSGKPLINQCPNCFKIEAENENIKEVLYWITYALWRSNAFHPFLIGSVIPFIRINDYKQLIINKMEVVNANTAEFTEMVKQLRLIELKEKQFMQNLQLIRELKQAYVYKYFNKHP
jgi:CMP-2-keto-3-deoxyoctulosonic acid synthetase